MTRLPWLLLMTLAVAFPTRGAEAARCPNLYIVLDRSGSMRDNGKWDAARTAIEEFTGGELLVRGERVPSQRFLRFGLMLYPRGTTCAAGSSEVACDFYQAGAIQSALAATSPGGATPTGESLAAAGRLDELKDPTRRKFVVLVTDGAPTCGPDSDGKTATNATRDYAVEQVQALRSADPALDVRTFVVGFGAGVDPATLDRMAEQGGTARTGESHKYYEANDAASLAAVFDAISRVTVGELGTARCDDSCHANGCPAGERCVESFETFPGDVTMNLGRCEPDPCWQKVCGAGEFCRDGACITSCPAPCPTGEVCRDGQCVADPCADRSCLCTSSCGDKLSCIEGRCMDDPCRNIRCPTGFLCQRGSCAADPYRFETKPGGTDAPDAGAPARGESDPDGSEATQGCSCSSGAGAPAGFLVGAALILGMAHRRRTHR